jgi:predicted NodU family carbamoyl transferase
VGLAWKPSTIRFECRSSRSAVAQFGGYWRASSESPRREFIEHHLAHATSAYFTSGFDVLVVTMDGGSDGCSAHVYAVRDGHFERLAATSAFKLAR